MNVELGRQLHWSYLARCAPALFVNYMSLAS